MAINVVCAIIYFGDKILVTQRSDFMKLPLKWEFPGGKIENNEKDVDCVKREIREELAIEIEITGKLTSTTHDYPSLQIHLIPFIAHYKSGTIKLAEHMDFKLLSVSELRVLDWAEADIPIVEELIRLNL